MKTSKRKPLSKKVRFEVFKRDSFCCQYCGHSAPDVLLHVDHIKPVSDGGTNRITNLITSCQSCNAGKGARLLSDDTVVSKQKAQLDALQERREQIEMIMAWHEGLIEVKDECAEKVRAYINKKLVGIQLNDLSLKPILKLLKDNTLQEVLLAVDVAIEQYVFLDNDGNSSRDGLSIMFSKLGGICYYKKNPEHHEAVKIRNLVRYRDSYDWSNQKSAMVISQIMRLIRSGVPVADIKSMAQGCSGYSSLKQAIKNQYGVDLL